MVPARISIATIGTRDLPAMREFYAALGWPMKALGDDFARFDTGGAILCLYPLDKLAEEGGVPAGAGLVVGLAINVDDRADVDAAARAWAEAGGAVTVAPRDMFWGGRCAHVADPEGNSFEIAWNPEVTFDAAGNPSWPV